MFVKEQNMSSYYGMLCEKQKELSMSFSEVPGSVTMATVSLLAITEKSHPAG